MIDPSNFPGRGQVAILRTRPETVLEDYARLMRLAHYQDNLPKDKETLLKINISWQIWYPSCSTTPWGTGRRRQDLVGRWVRPEQDHRHAQ